jgi:enoyl-[acyl-carrier protein] reductase I
MSTTETAERSESTPAVDTSKLLKGKKIAVFGVANKWSIAWGITQSLAAAGAHICLTYLDERTEDKVRSLATGLENPLILPCDVTQDDQVETVFGKIKHEFGHLDGLVHAIAFAKKEELEGSFVKTSREGFRIAMDVSAYSLIALARGAAPLMEGRDSSIVTLTYHGSTKVIPNYNVMGVAKAALECSVLYLAGELGEKKIRVNAISAGPINTLAARGISGFQSLSKYAAEKAPLRRNVEAGDVGDTAMFLCSPLSRGITGEIIYVDAGYNILGA